MEKVYVLFNILSGNGKGKEKSEELKEIIKDKELIYCDILKIEDYKEFFENTQNSDIVICGGDGTLNNFINNTCNIDYKNDIYLYPTGSGNDFFTDIEKENQEMPIKISKYLKKVPKVIVNGKERKFLNGIGYGIDGYCCEEGDRLRKKSDKPINYTKIAIKGLLLSYKPKNATITVDGQKYNFKKVWLAPTMNGRYYGGGMNIAPQQDRLNDKQKLSVVVLYGKGKLKTLIAFPTIFKGEHVEKHKDMVKVLEGFDINVEFDKPTALQIDGETISNVLSYEAISEKADKSEKVSK